MIDLEQLITSLWIFLGINHLVHDGCCQQGAIKLSRFFQSHRNATVRSNFVEGVPLNKRSVIQTNCAFITLGVESSGEVQCANQCPIVLARQPDLTVFNFIKELLLYSAPCFYQQYLEDENRTDVNSIFVFCCGVQMKCEEVKHANALVNDYTGDLDTWLSVQTNANNFDQRCWQQTADVSLQDQKSERF